MDGKQTIQKAILEYVDRGPEFIIVLMNKAWQYKDRDQHNMDMVFKGVLDKGKSKNFIPVLIDNEHYSVNFDENYDESGDGKNWIANFNNSVFKTSPANWIEKVVNVAQAKVDRTSAQTNMNIMSPPTTALKEDVEVIDVLCIVHDSNYQTKQALIALKDQVEKNLSGPFSFKKHHVRILEGFPEEDFIDELEEQSVHTQMVVFLGQGVDEVERRRSKDLDDDDDYDEADFSMKMKIVLKRLKPDIAMTYLQFGIDYVCREIVQTELNNANMTSSIVGLPVSASRNEDSLDKFLTILYFP